MKKLITAMLGMFVLSLGFAVAADKDAKLTTYTITMSGVTWGGCKKDVRAAFKGLDGVVAKDPNKDIEIAAGDKDRTKQKVTFKSTNAKLAKKDLVAAIGEKKKDRYKVEKVETSS